MISRDVGGGRAGSIVMEDDDCQRVGECRTAVPVSQVRQGPKGKSENYPPPAEWSSEDPSIHPPSIHRHSSFKSGIGIKGGWVDGSGLSTCTLSRRQGKKNNELTLHKRKSENKKKQEDDEEEYKQRQ
ncbi:hypothetical protein BO94DRAFT_574264 [Aspergillus sclerotioniger CBS 115572]|uniref:Uncharacterized protein n=1 Tax=Aspergillus sclerotioniger CBS 115572 TaxID=1450535 RepID=A0A317WZ46_9EURO|nr:hypothetical protein BO94DRAFT_574264 [Aspergillus sclerotioniger CBS 115572]PWY90537.1 hypothetical protein BO94DRAFT_574264 [Aspergillus sclerotioniger CBS 115572]